MRIPSGKTDQNIYFVAFDSSDHTTRKTGLSSFTVYRSRNGGTATACTTATVTELSSSNMPGVYALLIDEDTTIASASDSEEYAVHITATGMDPVSRTIELYRRGVTSGQTAAVDSSGRMDLGKIGGTAQTARDIGASVLLSPGTGTGQISLSSGAVTVGTNSDKTGYALTAAYDPAKTAAQAGDAMALTGDFTATMKTSLNTATPAVTVSDKTGFKLASDGLAPVTAWTVAITGDITGSLSGSVGSVSGLTASNLDVAVSTRLAATDYTAAPTAADNGAAVLDVVIADHLGAGSVGDAIYQAATHAINIDTQVGTAGAGLTAVGDARLAHLDADVSSRLAGASYSAPDNASVTAIKAKTDNLPASPAAAGDAMTLTVAYDAAKSAASQASVDAVATNITAVKASTDNLPSDPADESLVIAATDAIMARLGAPAGASVTADIAVVSSDTAAVKAKTDSLTFAVTGEIDANIKAVNDVAVVGLGTTGSPWGPA